MKESKRIYTKKDPSLLAYLKSLKYKVKQEFAGLTPYIGTDTCRTCGNTGKEHPDTAYCFICNTDNW